MRLITLLTLLTLTTHVASAQPIRPDGFETMHIVYRFAHDESHPTPAHVMIGKRRFASVVDAAPLALRMHGWRDESKRLALAEAYWLRVLCPHGLLDLTMAGGLEVRRSGDAILVTARVKRRVHAGPWGRDAYDVSELREIRMAYADGKIIGSRALR